MRPRKPADSKKGQPDPLLVTIDTAAGMLGIGRSKLYQLIAKGDIESVTLGRQIRRVPVASLNAYIARLLAEGNSGDAA